ncbi:hypothetical protein BOX15_Mlig003964g2 [Macrostomum lignano]|uniref:HMA domain-containing protein n=1 Tax=Macrostomum lignano TaxID=282301 RepID=A0A267FFW4_9PLAT|nr:hypothetical protein BOX15_Mlig003964g2 [Macrostomum lignano]
MTAEVKHAAGLDSRQPPMKELQFAVNMTCQSCADSVSRVLSSHQPASDFADIRIQLTEQQVILRTSLHVDSVLELLETTGCRAVLQGVGTASQGMRGQDFASGVVQLESVYTTNTSSVQGVVRILQPDDQQCLFDGTVDGLERDSWYSLEVRQGGDLSGGSDTCGPVYNDGSDDAQSDDPSGLVGRVYTGPSGRLRFSLISNRLRLWNLVGRCLTVSKSAGCSENVCAAGIVARSAGLFANDKRICSCDGVEIWSERDVPSVGAGRAAAAAALKK